MGSWSCSSLNIHFVVVVERPRALPDCACREFAVLGAMNILAGDLKCPIRIARKSHAQGALQCLLVRVSRKNPHSYEADVMYDGCIISTAPEARCESNLDVTDPRENDLVHYHMMLEC